MVVSFKISKKGTRFQPKPLPKSDEASSNCMSDDSNDDFQMPPNEKNKINTIEDNTGNSSPPENEVSFTLNLFSDGYSIGKPSENEAVHQLTSQEMPKLLHPYDRASESFFSAIESGHLPGDSLDDIPLKYVNGTVLCEVRDYRNCGSEPGHKNFVDGSLIVHKICLRMTLENIVKDIALISDSSWTYGDLMEAEARMLKALQPKICLDPTPKLDRLCADPVPYKLNLDIRSMRRKRLSQTQEIDITSNDMNQGKKICIDRVPDLPNGSLPSDMIINSHNFNPTNNMLSVRTRSLIPDAQVSALVSNQPRHQMGQDITSYTHNMSPNPNQDGKRARLAPPSGLDDSILQQQQSGQINVDGTHGSDLQWRNTIFQQQANGRGMQYNAPSVQRYNPQMLDGVLNQYPLKEEQIETEKLDRLPQHGFMRSVYPQTSWNNNIPNQNIENEMRREDQGLQKRKSVQSPRVSSGPMAAQSPLSSKSGEFSSGGGGGSLGPNPNSQFNSVKGGVSSSGNESMQRQQQQQAQFNAKRRSNSLPRTQIISGVGSPASVGNPSVPLNANSPSVGTEHLSDQAVLDRLSKLKMIMRHRPSSKKNRVDEYPVRKLTFSSQDVSACLSNASNNEDFKDDAWPLSKSLVGGNMNISKLRVLNFMQQERIVQANVASVVNKARTRMIMSEKIDGTVAVYYGDIDDGEYMNSEEYLPTLPNSHFADLLAAQFSSLMVRDGHLMEDNIQAKPNRIFHASTSQLQNNPSTNPNNNQVLENETERSTNSGNMPLNHPSPNHMGNARMLPPGTPQGLQMSQQGPLPGVPHPRPQQVLDPQTNLQSYQRSPLMMTASPLSHLNTIGQTSNMQMGNNQMGNNNKPSPLQLQILQQQRQQQQQQQQMPPHQQMQRKMMTGHGNPVMGGNMGNNNLVGLGGLGNIMGMGGGGGGAKGMIGNSISTPNMGPNLSGIGNISQNPMNLNQVSNISNALSQLRSGSLPSQAALMAASKLRMRSNLLGGPQSNLAGIPGSMMGQALNRANMNPMGRPPMGSMAPPKLMTAMNNPYLNQHQQLQYQQQQQQMQQQLLQQQQQQQQIQQQETPPPPLHGVVSSPQVSSPSVQQQLSQQASPHPQQQQMSQQTPMSPQISSGGTMPPHMSGGGGGPEGCPASPQLSSQTHGSIGSSITNSPKDPQGSNA